MNIHNIQSLKDIINISTNDVYNIRIDKLHNNYINSKVFLSVLNEFDTEKISKLDDFFVSYFSTLIDEEKIDKEFIDTFSMYIVLRSICKYSAYHLLNIVINENYTNEYNQSIINYINYIIRFNSFIRDKFHIPNTIKDKFNYILDDAIDKLNKNTNNSNDVNFESNILKNITPYLLLIPYIDDRNDIEDKMFNILHKYIERFKITNYSIYERCGDIIIKYVINLIDKNKINNLSKFNDFVFSNYMGSWKILSLYIKLSIPYNTTTRNTEYEKRFIELNNKKKITSSEISCGLKYCYMYLGKKWPEAEPIFSRNVAWALEYCKRNKTDICIKGENKIIQSKRHYYIQEYKKILTNNFTNEQIKEKIKVNPNLLTVFV